MSATKSEAFVNGQKAFESKNYESAIEFFAQACEQYSGEHEGEDDPDLLFEYAQAVFNFAKSQVTLFNTENWKNQNSAPAAVPQENIQLEPLEELEVVPEGEKSSAELAKEETAAEKEEAGGEAEGDAAPEEGAAAEAEEDDFTIAWNLLDTCRVLYLRQLDIAKDKSVIENKLARVYESLGRVALEDDSFEPAVQDLTSALELKEKLLGPEDRLMSEAHYWLAFALEGASGDSISQKKDAYRHYQRAAEIAKKNGVDTNSIQELRQKAHDLKKEIDTMKSEPSSSAPTSAANAGGIDRNAVKNMLDTLSGAQDLGALVKRKRKEAPVENKKAKSDDSTAQNSEKKEADSVAQPEETKEA